MRNGVKISVLVALYNAENFLHRFLDSILNQTLKDFDVIIVDDGSTDRSYAICQEFAKYDRRIRLYRKQNGGVSSARNYCLNILREEGGAIIVFLQILMIGWSPICWSQCM